MQTQGDRVNEVRKFLNLTLEKFGERLGVTKTAISRLEKGERALTKQMILAICREYDINEVWLRTGKGEMFVTFTRNQVITDFAGDLIREPESFKARLIEGLAKLDESDWEDIERVVLKIFLGKSEKFTAE